MDELNINYSNISKGKQIMNIIIAIFLLVFCLYFSITEGIANRFDILFIASLVGVVMAGILLLNNTLWKGSPSIIISSSAVKVSLKGQSNTELDWVNVSEVNIGVSYIVFMLNGGQKQRKIDLSNLIYNDVNAVKSKVLELCQFKNIPYKND